MNYQLTIRKFTEDDVGLDCKFMPDGELEIYAKALMEELVYADTVSDVSLLENTIDECKIEIIVYSIGFEELQSFVFSILSTKTFKCVLRHKDLQPIKWDR